MLTAPTTAAKLAREQGRDVHEVACELADACRRGEIGGRNWHGGIIYYPKDYDMTEHKIPDFAKAWHGYFVEDGGGNIRPWIVVQASDPVTYVPTKGGMLCSFVVNDPKGEACLLSCLLKGVREVSKDDLPILIGDSVTVMKLRKPVCGNSGEWYREAIVDLRLTTKAQKEST